MSNTSQKPVVSNHGTQLSSLTAYCTGFVLSLILTICTYLLATHHALTTTRLMLLLAIFAVIQLVVQLVFFLHLAQEARPRWRLWAFGGLVGVIIILVFGSIWIMNNLNYHMMTPKQLVQYMQQNEGL